MLNMLNLQSGGGCEPGGLFADRQRHRHRQTLHGPQEDAGTGPGEGQGTFTTILMLSQGNEWNFLDWENLHHNRSDLGGLHRGHPAGHVLHGHLRHLLPLLRPAPLPPLHGAVATPMGPHGLLIHPHDGMECKEAFTFAMDKLALRGDL